MFRLDEDHEELRALAREIATEQVAPHAAAVSQRRASTSCPARASMPSTGARNRIA